jgi:hypothetical protein
MQNFRINGFFICSIQNNSLSLQSKSSHLEITMKQEEQTQSTNKRSIEMCRRTVTTESFIAEATAIYGERYDYSKVEYKNREHRVAVICPVHGEFNVFAR